MKIQQLVRKKHKASRVMGIDASSNSIAFTIFFNRRPQFYGKLTLQGDNIYEKAGDASRKTLALLQLHKVDYVAIEKAVYVQNRETVIKLSYVFGAIMGAIGQRNIPVTDIPPTTWQAYIGNTPFSRQEKQAFRRKHPRKTASWYSNEIRKIRKQRTIDYFNKRYKLKLDDDDVADSMGVSLYSYEKLTRRK